MDEKKLTTVAIYRDDLKRLSELCSKGENFRDRITKILDEYLENGK